MGNSKIEKSCEGVERYSEITFQIEEFRIQMHVRSNSKNPFNPLHQIEKLATIRFQLV